jgi:alkyl hydroperoxide reductase subunit AhpC
LSEFAEYDAQVVGISIDSISSHIAFQEFETGTLGFPLGSDFYPHGEIAERYGVLRLGPPIPGITERAIFIINKEGTIVFRKIYHLGEQPDLDEVLGVLRRLKREEVAAGSAHSGR